jgi:hypothetical protein
VRETFVAVITTNLPMLFPLFKRWLSPCVGGLKSTIKSSKASSSKPPTLETIGQKNRGKAPRSLNHITTFNDSEERMMELNTVPPSQRTGQRTPSDSDSDKHNNGIQRRVDYGISQERAAPSSRTLQGNYTSASPGANGATRTTYFADHVRTENYRRK